MDKIEKLKELKSLLDSGVIDQNEFAQMKSEILGGTFDKSAPVTNLEEVKIGDQVWMKRNLDVSTFRNGDLIPEVKSDEEWVQAGKAGKPAWCYYDNDLENGKKYGKLYNWFAVNNSRGLAPEGWHVPNHKEYERLSDFLGGDEIAGTKIKNNGFSALAGGCRSDDKRGFINLGEACCWWSGTDYYEDDGSAWSRWAYITERVFYGYANNKTIGYYVRCIRD